MSSQDETTNNQCVSLEERHVSQRTPLLRHIISKMFGKDACMSIKDKFQLRFKSVEKT